MCFFTDKKKISSEKIEKKNNGKNIFIFDDLKRINIKSRKRQIMVKSETEYPVKHDSTLSGGRITAQPY